MNILGWFLAFGGFCGIVFSLRMVAKGNKVGSVPFRQPGDITREGLRSADAKGLVSTEGQVDLGPQPLIAPMSGERCLAFEIVVERKWEATEGDQKKSGSESVFSDYRGSTFYIHANNAAVRVDVSAKPDATFKKSHSSRQNVGTVIPGTLVFGHLQMNTPSMPRHHGRTIALVGTEKIIPAGNVMYALGALQETPSGATITKPKGITSSLILAEGGREALIGKTRRNMLLGSTIGSIVLVGGILLGVLGPKASDSPTPGANTPAAAPTSTAH
jgi:hypothetical protein